MRPQRASWIVNKPALEAPRLAREAGISPLQAQILVRRGIDTPDAAERFLSPRLADLSPPGLLKDMDRAVDCVLRAARNGLPITVYGDYDADGLTATALLVRFFSDLDLPAFPYVPDRFKEGYGLNRDAVDRIAGSRGGLLITVDCGTGNLEEVKRAVSRGLDVVVTDHHRVPDDFEAPCPVLNPKRPDCSFPSRGPAGVGVAFYLAVAVRAAMREAGWFTSRPEPDLRSYLDLVAIGTLADMVPLLEENRRLVTAGMQVMKTSRWPGLLALQEQAGIAQDRVCPEDVAFRLAPRINAAGRLGEARVGLEALLTSDPASARRLAGQLHALNDHRQELERDILARIESRLPAGELAKSRRTLILHGEGWHQGVLGIVASRIAMRYGRPAIVLDVKDGVATGSGRSIDGFDLHGALQGLDGLFLRFGGHSRAVGLSLETRFLDHLSEGMEAAALEQLTEADLRPTLRVEAELPLADVTEETIDEIQRLGPFGSGNPEPLFLAGALDVLESRVVGDRHLKLRVAHQGKELEAISFDHGHLHPLGGTRVSAVYYPRINRWKGVESLQLNIQALYRAGE
ncbi:MAG: single-stranded-DNA-specific exonuclease RecJ [Deltaproteobacteria bacterium]|nr:single-stranded-DNA-specific exonuclease RecJ [Deltaproteobacteria bacterium]